MIATALNFPGQCIYSYVKETRTRSELATIAIALVTFSGTTSYFVPLSYTFASFSVLIIYAGQFNAAKSEYGKIPDFLNRRIFAISLSIIVGAKIGQKMREYCYPLENPGPWYSVSLKTPLHLFNNLLVYVTSPLYLNEIVDLKAVGSAALLPGQFIRSHMDKLQTDREKKIGLIAAFTIGALASYWVSLSYTFSTVIVITLICGGHTDEIPLHFVGSLYLLLLGSKIGKMVANYRFPSSLPWYSVNWKTPFHIMNNAMIIGIPIGVILAALSYLNDPRSPLPDLTYTPMTLKKSSRLDDLKIRVLHLEGLKFELDPSIKSRDDICAAHYILLSDPKWTREEVRHNYKILVVQTHTDKNPNLDKKYNQYVTQAAQVLKVN